MATFLMRKATHTRRHSHTCTHTMGIVVIYTDNEILASERSLCVALRFFLYDLWKYIGKLVEIVFIESSSNNSLTYFLSTEHLWRLCASRVFLTTH